MSKAEFDAVAREVIAFFNSVKKVEDIQRVVVDDPNFGAFHKHGITSQTAKKIIKVRDKLPGQKFSSLKQLDKIPGVGTSTLHNILVSFLLPRDKGPQYFFRVAIEGVVKGSFDSVAGLGSSTEIIEYKDGSDAVVRKRPGRTITANLILQRACTKKNEFMQWRRNITEGVVERRNGTVSILDKNHKEIARFTFLESWPARISYIPTTQGNQRDIREEIELACELIERTG